MIAIKRLQNILWILVVAFGALTAYLISLRVATERNAVHALDQQIYRVRGDIRYLETEFEARASMRQLERWNNQDYRYVAPQSAQYLPDERALASLDRVEPNGNAYVAPPVMMAMVDSSADLPAATAARTASPAAVQIRETDTMIRAQAAGTSVSAPVIERSAKAVAPKPVAAPVVAPVRTARAPEAVERKVARMALLDAKLLDDRTLRDLGSQAAAEVRGKVMR